MKHMNYFLGSAFLLFMTGTSYGCNLNAHTKEKTTLVTQSTAENAAPARGHHFKLHFMNMEMTIFLLVKGTSDRCWVLATIWMKFRRNCSH